ncbi:TRAP transporter small permease [Salinibacillus xinjiangensis]|uniref:TRAP transporter small permease subunit n=1 Tax=Salinibacillus xinjiangensis TaxID=1229268 RepID=A0A6G1X240_9BACI|nr:TRAP transporter small permease [Salinibacillus xinjiangensis]MRG84960.1 TRAP transporter small permease subunit [Salinibacillus xinjiangensis]
MQAINILSRILKILTITSFSALVLVVIIQITGRYTPFSFVWTEELSRFLFIFSIAFAAPIAMEQREYVRVDLFVDFLPKKVRKYVEALIYLILGLFSAYLVSFAYEFSLIGQNQSSATLSIEMFYIHLSMVILFVFLALYSFFNIYAVLKLDQHKELDQQEEKEGVNL